MEYRTLLKDLKWEVTLEEAKAHLHVMEDDEEDFEEIYREVYKRIKPIYYVAEEKILSNDGHDFNIGGKVFTSRVCSVNLENCETVYPYVGTSGREAYEYALSLKDPLFTFWADSICELALYSVGKSFREYMKEKLDTQDLYSLNPGSVIDWPIGAQGPLFELIGNVYENTGIVLEPTFLMRPVKSNSGILYVSKKHFQSCSLCIRNGCPNRREPFDPEKFNREYAE